ncbi:MAG: hypothetical protein IJS00_04675 [Paludibacteraceae bacterium]|nr:hypothetical protein [Paludibacteraceae bacterium]
MKKIRFFLSLLMLFSISVGNVWADYTISFKDTGGDDGTSAKTAIADLISSSSGYVQSIDAVKAYQAKSGFGVKLASSKAVGYVNITLKATGENIGQVKAEKIVVNAAYYDESKTMKVTVTYTENTTREQTLNTLTSSIASYDVTLDSEKTIKGIKIESVTQSKGRVYCHSIQVVAASSGSAEPSGR